MLSLEGCAVFEALLIVGCISFLLQSTSIHELATALEGRVVFTLSLIPTVRLVFPQQGPEPKAPAKKMCRQSSGEVAGAEKLMSHCLKYDFFAGVSLLPMANTVSLC